MRSRPIHLAVCVVLAAAALLLALVDPRAALTGWLGAAAFVAGLPTGALILLLMMRLISGRWRDDLGEPALAAVRLWPLAALSLVPVLIGMGAIYPWVGHAPESAFARLWWNPIFFAVRTVGWFVVLGALSWRALAGEVSAGLASFGLIALTLAASLVAVDWLMSLDPAFVSSGFGLQVLALEICAALAALILLRLAWGDSQHLGIMSGLLLTMLLLWAYFMFLPFFIVWSGNLPDGVAWYLARAGTGWVAALAASSVLGGVPLFALMAPDARQSARWLGALSACVLAGKAVEFAWLALPGRGGMAVLAFCLALAGLGGLATLGLLRGRAA
jgi:hypothetical protein